MEVDHPPGLLQEWLGQHLFCDLKGLAFWAAMLFTIVAFFAVIAGLQALGSGPRRRLTQVCTFLAGLFYLLSFFLPPGNKAWGELDAGGRKYPLTADVTWTKPKEAPPAKGAPATPEQAAPTPPTRSLKGQIELSKPPAGAKAAEPKEFVDFLPVEGTAGPDGRWSLTLMDQDGPHPLTPARHGYATTWRGQPAMVSLSVQPALNVLKAYEQPLGDFLLVVGAFTIGLGVINLVAVHGRTLLRAQTGWHNSLAFFLGFLGMAIIGIWNLKFETPDQATTLALVPATYRVLFDGLLVPLQSTTFALLGFFIVTAAYRAFRIRSLEAGLMTVVAFVVMLGQVPIGQLLTAWINPNGPWASLRLENITNWLLTVPNTAATRGIVFGSAVGGFALSLRVWLSLERGSYFDKEF